MKTTAEEKNVVDFDIRLFRVSPSGTEGTMTRPQMLEYLKSTYPADDGWKIVTVQFPGYEAGALNVGVYLEKYG